MWDVTEMPGWKEACRRVKDVHLHLRALFKALQSQICVF